MKKVSFLLSALLLAVVHVTYAQTPTVTYDVQTSPVPAITITLPEPPNKNTQFRLGAQGGVTVPMSVQLGIWGEHSWDKTWGIRAGGMWEGRRVGGFMGITSITSQVTYYTVPILLTARLDAQQRTCVFGGIQLGYRSSIGVQEVDKLESLKKNLTKTEDEDKVCTQLSNKLAAFDKDKTSSFQVGLVFGGDYEFPFGLIVSLQGVKYLLDPGKETCYDGWQLHPSWSILPTVGYNLMRLFT